MVGKLRGILDMVGFENRATDLTDKMRNKKKRPSSACSNASAASWISAFHQFSTDQEHTFNSFGQSF
jgi:transposase-like protein